MTEFLSLIVGAGIGIFWFGIMLLEVVDRSGLRIDRETNTIVKKEY